jgi:hypothetical protein
LTLDERIRCQEALERVDWTHRSKGQGRSFEQAVPRTVLRRSAEDAVLKTEVLRRFWGVTITPERLQAELDRMAAHSKAPARLGELFAALGDDPVKAAECLARPLLVDRLIRTSYAFDERRHGDLRARARREVGELASAAALEATTGVRTEVEWRRGHDRTRTDGRLELEPEAFDARVRELRAEMGQANAAIVLDRPSPLREDESRFYVLVVHELDDRHVSLTTIEWPKRPFDSWWTETRERLTPEPMGTAFEFRLPALAGAACPDDTWTPTLQLLDPRYWHTAVWTGSEMIVFGGIGTFTTDTIAKRYRPATDTWTDATAVDAPGSRDHHTAVWTGTEMIVWGGFINDGTTPTGGRYDPVADAWTPTNVAGSPITRMWPIGVWTGTEMIVWGGYEWLFVGDLGDGARYDPATDSWTPTSLVGAPTPRVAQGVWTGGELLLWGGANDSSGARYDPVADSWRPTTFVDAPPVRAGGRWSTVWTGSEMIIWGGINDTQQGSRYCAAPGNGIFSDGFESGDASAWSLLAP